MIVAVVVPLCLLSFAVVIPLALTSGQIFAILGITGRLRLGHSLFFQLRRLLAALTRLLW
jgi:hypothetical protein